MNELAISKPFEERLKERIKESFGDLMTDEELKALIVKGVDAIFFQPRIIQEEYGKKKHPPLIEELLAEQLKPLAQDAVREYVKDHENEMCLKIHEGISKDIGQLLVTGVQALFGDVFSTFQYNLEQGRRRKR